VNVLNSSASALNASNVAWDTTSLTGPDLFSCNATLSSCTCEIMTCTNNPGGDGMDAVYTSTGSVTTTGFSLSKVAVGCN
jgi:hypothetical protein